MFKSKIIAKRNISRIQVETEAQIKFLKPNITHRNPTPHPIGQKYPISSLQ